MTLPDEWLRQLAYLDTRLADKDIDENDERMLAARREDILRHHPDHANTEN